MKAYSSSNKQKLHFPSTINTFEDPMDFIHYPIRFSTNMDAQPTPLIFLAENEHREEEMRWEAAHTYTH